MAGGGVDADPRRATFSYLWRIGVSGVFNSVGVLGASGAFRALGAFGALDAFGEPAGRLFGPIAVRTQTLTIVQRSDSPGRIGLDVVIFPDWCVAVGCLAPLILQPQEFLHTFRKEPAMRIHGEKLIGSGMGKEPFQPDPGRESPA